MQIAGNVKLGKVKNANIKCSFGNVQIAEVLNKMEVSADCGNVEVDKVSIKENSNIKADMGNIIIDEVNDIYVEAEVNLGKTNIGKNNRDSDIMLKLVCKCGNVRVGE